MHTYHIIYARSTYKKPNKLRLVLSDAKNSSFEGISAVAIGPFCGWALEVCQQWWCYPPESTSTDLNKTLSIKNLPIKHIFNKKNTSTDLHKKLSMKNTFNKKNQWWCYPPESTLTVPNSEKKILLLL